MTVTLLPERALLDIWDRTVNSLFVAELLGLYMFIGWGMNYLGFEVFGWIHEFSEYCMKFSPIRKFDRTLSLPPSQLKPFRIVMALLIGAAVMISLLEPMIVLVAGIMGDFRMFYTGPDFPEGLLLAPGLLTQWVTMRSTYRKYEKRFAQKTLREG